VQIAKRGKAALTIVSQSFTGLGSMQAKALGVPKMPFVVIPHPFGSRKRDEVQAIAQRCADEVAKVMGAEART